MFGSSHKIGRRVFGLCALFLSTLLAQSPALVQKAERAKQLMAAGQFADAVPLYTEMVKAMPGNPGLRLNLAMAQHMAGQDRAAVANFEKVLAAQPRAFPALMMLGVSQMRLAQPAKAVPVFERALAIQPDEMDARRMLGDALLMLGRYEAALPHLRYLTAKLPKEPRAWYGLGRCYEFLAEAAYRKLLKTAPESAYTLALTADAQSKRQRLSSAEALYKQAAALGTAVPGLHSGLADVYERNGNAAAAAAERALERTPGCTAASVSLACQFANGRYAQLLRAARLKSGPEALFWTARAYNALALEALRKLSTLPPSPELHEVIAELYRSQGKYKESVAEWDQAVSLSPGDARLWRERAVTLYMSSDYAAAESALKEELKREPDAPDLLFLLGDSLLNQQRAAEALPLLEKSVAADPQHLPARASLARTYLQLDQMAKAVPHLEAALSIDTDGSLHYQLSRAYQAGGRDADARKMLERYQELQKQSTAQ